MSDKDDKLRNELDAFVADYNDKNKTKFKSTGVKGSRKRTGKGTQGHRQFGGVDFSGYGKSKEENTKFMDAMAKRGFRVIDELDAPSYSRKGKKRHVIHIDSMREDVGNTKEKRGTIRKERSVKRKSNNYPIQRVEREQLYRSEMEPSQRAGLLNKEKPLFLKDKLKGLSQIDPTGSNTKENIEAVLENDPNKLVPQITKDTPRIAMIPNNEDGRDLTEAEKRRRARFLAVQGGATPPKEITKVLGVDDSSEEINLITEQAPSPIAARNIANPRPVKEAQEARERVATESKERAVIQSSEKKNQGDSVIKSNPNQVKELIKSMPEMDPELQRDVEKDINLKNQGRHTERSGPASQFTEALSFFLPQIIGGLAGAAFEGTEGAIGGIEASGQARDAFLKHQETKMAREAKENKTDYKTFVDEKGRPVAKKGNSFLDLTGKQVDPSKVTQAVTFRQTRSLDQRNVEGIDRNDRFNKKFELDKQKAGQLSDTQIKDRQRVTNVLASIDRITTLKEGVDTGPFADKWGRLAEYFDKQPEGFTELKSESSDGLAKYVQALSGAQVSEQEARRLGAIIPTTADNDETFKRKLKVFKKIMEDNQAGFDEAIKSGQPLKAGQVKGLQEAEAQFLSKRNTSKKGKGVMTDKQRNRMKELQEKYPNRG